jgi:hypothetical protein
MKKQIKFRWYNYLLLISMVIFVGMGASYAQSGQGNGKKAQRFAQCDRNGDGFVGKGECQNAQMSNFDQNGDGVLSRKEYRRMKKNQAMKGRGNNGQRLRDGSGNGQGQGQGQGYRRNNSQRNAQGTNRNNRSGRNKGRRGG